MWFRGKWYGPSYPDAGDLPVGRTVVNDTGRAEQVLSPAQTSVVESVVEQGAGLSRDAQPVPPPKAGAGSSRVKWAAYAAAHDVAFDGDATRDDIIDACAAAGVPIDQAE